MNKTNARTLSVKAGPRREWIAAGRPECAHYWVGTGERRDGAERFVCRWCGAQMKEPLELSPVRKEPETPPPPGCVACAACGAHTHWSRTARNPLDCNTRVCLDCLSDFL